jgi:F-type H+-transporting ATPase subunit delta
MSRPVAAARRYAEAAFEVALAENQLDGWKADLEAAVVMLGRPDVEPTVHSPAVPLKERVEIVRQLLEPRIARGPMRLVTLVVERGKVHALPKISEEYTRLLNAHRGVVVATVTSAVPLTADETAAIRSRVEAMAGSRVELRSEINPDLIGGLTIQVRDRLLDASIRGRLERLRDQLHAGGRLR